MDDLPTRKFSWTRQTFHSAFASHPLAAIVSLIVATFTIYASFNSIYLTSPSIQQINALGWWPTSLVMLACLSLPALFFLALGWLANRDDAKHIEELHRRISDPEYIRIVRTKKELYDELYSVIDEANQYLVVAGSRSRDEKYLRKIRDKISSSSHLEFYCVLFGRPRNKVFTDHLREIFNLVPPARTQDGTSNLHVALLPFGGRFPERFVCANEKKAIVPIQSLNRIDEHDTALILTNPQLVGELVSQFKNMVELNRARRIRAASEVPDHEPYPVER